MTDDPPPPPPPQSSSDDAHPGVPLFKTWGAVYAFVIGFFVLVVAVLAVFSHVFA